MVVGSARGEAKRERERRKANEQYFLSLADSRASLTSLPMMGLLTAFLMGLVLPFLWSLVFYAGYQELSLLFYAHLVVIGFSLVVCVVSAFRGWVFRYQVFSSSLTVFFTIVWVYTLCLAAIFMATMDVGVLGDSEFSSTRLETAGVFGSLYVCGAFVVHVLLLRHRLRVGHSQKRMMGNYLAASSVYSSKSLWIIFVFALIVPNFLTGGEYILVTFGGLGFLLFASVCPSLPVEFGYLTYLKARDRKYWEQRPPKVVVERAQKIRTLKKTGKVTLIILGVIVALTILSEIWK